ncbi:DNA topoisomerase 1 [Chamberlinius hualienensis]
MNSGGGTVGIEGMAVPHSNGAGREVKAQSLKLKISTNQADGTSKVVSSSSNHHHHHNHSHHHQSAKISSKDHHKKSAEVQKSKPVPGNVQKIKKESSSTVNSSKPKENSHSSKDGKHSSKPKDGEKHKDNSINKAKSSSSSHSNSNGKISSSKDSKSKPATPSSGDKKLKDGKSSNSSSSSKHTPSGSSSSVNKLNTSNSKDSKSPSVNDKKKPSSSDSKSAEKHKSGDKSKDHKHRDKENHENKDKSNIKVENNKTKDLKDKQKVKVKEEPVTPVKVKSEILSDDDAPLAQRKSSSGSAAKVKQVKREKDELEDESLQSRMQKAKPSKPANQSLKKRKQESDSEDEPISKRMRDSKTSTATKKRKIETITTNEEKKNDGSKWSFLEHKGPVFAPPYEPLPKNVKFLYNGKLVELSESAEEVASMYAKFLEHDYTSKEAFNKNFFKDWRKMMTAAERDIITDLKKCDFRHMHKYFMEKNEERKNMTKDQKLTIKKENQETQDQFGFCTIDGHKEKIGNFKTEPPGLFRGRGEHPKMGMLKKRIMPEDVIINCSKNSKVPVPPPGHRWKEVRHDNTVTWLACWQENIQGQTKYIMLNPSSKLKGEKDWQKYETARKLKSCVEQIRDTYKSDWKSKEMKVRQRAVALYFIDKLALRAGNEKEEGETADTVGCCSLRVEHITLNEEKDGEENVVSFDFLGKDSIRYVNSVSVEKRVFKNLKLFMDNKQPGDDLFDRLNTTILNKHLNELMDGLTAKVFRTFNASKTLQEQLELLTNPDDALPAKMLAYNRANRAVAILCNHQRAVPKTFGKSMENLQAKIDDKKGQVKEAKKELKDVEKACRNGRSDRDKTLIQKKKKALERLNEQLMKLELQATDKEENKQIALGTSKLNYLDPRISVAWCKKWNIPVEKIYNRTQRDKFRWAIEMATPDFKF